HGPAPLAGVLAPGRQVEQLEAGGPALQAPGQAGQVGGRERLARHGGGKGPDPPPPGAPGGGAQAGEGAPHPGGGHGATAGGGAGRTSHGGASSTSRPRAASAGVPATRWRSSSARTTRSGPGTRASRAADASSAVSHPRSPVVRPGTAGASARPRWWSSVDS